MSSRFGRLFIVVVAIATAGAACGRYSISNIRSLKAFQDANKEYTKNNYKPAIVRYEDAIRLNPDLGFAYFFLGNSYDNLYKPALKGEPENDAYLIKATEHYRTAIEKLKGATTPKELECRNRAFQYLINAYGADKLNDFSKAEPIAKELIQAEPGEPANYQLLGRLYEDLGRYEEAEASYTKAIEMRPSEGLAYQVLAGYYGRRGEFDKMMQAWYSRAKVEPNNPEAWHAIATNYWDKVFRDKRLARATALEYTKKGILAADEAIKLNPDYYEAVTFKNILLRQQALYERDPATQKRLLEEADVVQRRALELQKKQNAGGDAGKKK
jgi:tetratricopeptide (TPR) repeat protein